MTRNNIDHGAEASQFPLARVLLAGCATVCIYGLATSYTASVLNGDLREVAPQKWTKIAQYSLPAQALLLILIAATSIAFFRPIASLFHWEQRTEIRRRISIWKIVGLGVGGAISALILSMPLKSSIGTGIGSMALHLGNIVAPNIELFLVVPIAVILTFAFALSIELLIRGIIMRGLAAHFGLPISIVISCFVSYIYWPLACPLWGMVIAVISSLLYYRSRTLWPSIIACAIFIIAVGPLSIFIHR